MIALIATYWYIAIPAIIVLGLLITSLMNAAEKERDAKYNTLLESERKKASKIAAQAKRMRY